MDTNAIWSILRKAQFLLVRLLLIVMVSRIPNIYNSTKACGKIHVKGNKQGISKNHCAREGLSRLQQAKLLQTT